VADEAKKEKGKDAAAAPARASLAARMKAMAQGAPAEKKEPEPAKPAAPAAAAEGTKSVRRSSLAAKLRAEVAAREAGGAAPSAAEPAKAAAPPAAPKTAAPAPAAKAAPAAAARASPAAPTAAPAAVAAPSVARAPAPAPQPVAKAPPPPEATYVDEAIASRLPVAIRRILRRAATEDHLEAALARMKSLRGPELERQKGLFEGFVENMSGVLRNRFLQFDFEKAIFFDEMGDLSLRTGDGEVKVQASCWELFFLSQRQRPLGQNRMAVVQQYIAEVLKFAIEDTGVCKMKVDTPVDFAPDENACYFEATLDLGGWCDMRFGGASVFSDGRVLVVTLEPRVVRGKDIPPPKGVDPKQFASMLAKMRRRA
jgi:hypothetical protein